MSEYKLFDGLKDNPVTKGFWKLILVKDTFLTKEVFEEEHPKLDWDVWKDKPYDELINYF